MEEVLSNARTSGSDRRWFVLTAIGVGTFMSALDGSVVNTVPSCRC